MELTAYQTATVEHVSKVFNNNRAYIVADEVGLGKTFVSIGLIKKMKYKRIIYIASNSEIAKQNVDKLIEMLKDGKNKYKVVEQDRLSLMAFNEYKNENYIMSLSPATTFTGKGSKFGDKKERNYYKKNAEKVYTKKSDVDNVINVLLEIEKKRDPSALRERFGEFRSKFAMKALEKFEPDLIIMDEFHRFHTLLDPMNKDLQFNLWDYINKESVKTKLLLLSATPYKYNEDVVNDEFAVSHEDHDEDKDILNDDGWKDDNPFDDFETLRDYMEQINNCSFNEYKQNNPENTKLDYIYDCILCRTEREWLTSKNEKFSLKFSPVSIPEMKKHFEWKVKWQKECLGLVQQISANEDDEDYQALQKIINNNKKKGIVMQKVLSKSDSSISLALQDYSNIRTYLDETPEYLQFAFRYSSVYARNGKNEGTYKQLKNALSYALSAQNNYRIRKKGDTVDYDYFKKTYGHYKWDATRQIALPENSEFLLWVLPLLTEYDKESIFYGLKDYSKVLVFAKYKMSTRAIAALTSMEAEIRLDTIIASANAQVVERNIKYIDEEIEKGDTLDELITVIKDEERFPEISDNDINDIKNTIKQFFNTSYSKKVLTAWSIKMGIDEEILLKYCEAAKWNEMLKEYIECINDYNEKLNFEKTKKQICSVLNWSDDERTKLVIMPDWKDESYTCSFGDRYIDDYSDKGANDEAKETDKKEKNNTRWRLKYLRERFQSPFYPFVLAASEVAQEGVDLHNYCSNIIHWSSPSSLSAYIQEEGRVNRRCSYAMRKRMRDIYRKQSSISNCKTFRELYNKSSDIFDASDLVDKDINIEEQKKIGLFPMWYLPDVQGIEGDDIKSISLFMQESVQSDFYERMRVASENYSKFGVNIVDDDIKLLCPYIKMQIAENNKNCR